MVNRWPTSQSCSSHMLVTNLSQLRWHINPPDSLNVLTRETWRDVGIKTKESIWMFCTSTLCRWQFSSMSLYLSQLYWCIYFFFFASATKLLFVLATDTQNHPRLPGDVYISSRPSAFLSFGAAIYPKNKTKMKVYLKSTGLSLRPRSLFLWFLRVSVDAVQVWQWWCLGALRKEALRHRLGSSPDSGTNTSLMGTNIPLGIRHQHQTAHHTLNQIQGLLNWLTKLMTEGWWGGCGGVVVGGHSPGAALTLMGN